MNYLSNKFSRALNNPTFSKVRRFRSITPSSASTIVNTPIGTKVVGSCIRQQYYRIKNFEPDNSPVNIDWTLSAIIGDKMHHLVEEIIDVFGFEMKLQKLTKEHSIYDHVSKLSGRSDFIVWDYENNEPIGIEVKSVGEYKAKKSMEQPSEEHVLQAVVYLDFYNKHIPDNQKKITKWFIWYISRTENWSIKAKDHGSPFEMMWDFCIELKDNIPIVTLGTGIKQQWTDFSIDKIYARYDQLNDFLAKDLLPPRDYELQYSDEKIAALHQANMISRKGDKEAIEKWLKKGAPPGKHKVTLGDGECMFCEYKKVCMENMQPSPKEFSNLPKKKEDNKSGILFL